MASSTSQGRTDPLPLIVDLSAAGDRAPAEGAATPGQAPAAAVPRRRQIRGGRVPAEAVRCDSTTQWGSPFRPGGRAYGLPVQDARHAASLYLGFAPQNDRLVTAARESLVGRDLACRCRLCDVHREGRPFDVDCPYCDRCHLDTLGKLANGIAIPGMAEPG